MVVDGIVLGVHLNARYQHAVQYVAAADAGCRAALAASMLLLDSRRASFVAHSDVLDCRGVVNAQEALSGHKTANETCYLFAGSSTITSRALTTNQLPGDLAGDCRGKPAFASANSGGAGAMPGIASIAISFSQACPYVLY